MDDAERMLSSYEELKDFFEATQKYTIKPEGFKYEEIYKNKQVLCRVSYKDTNYELVLYRFKEPLMNAILLDLQNDLDKALEAENYELCKQIEDKIKELRDEKPE